MDCGIPDVAVGTALTPNSMASQDEGANYIPASGQLAILNVLNTESEGR